MTSDTSWRGHDVGREEGTVMREGFVMEEAPEGGREGSEKQQWLLFIEHLVWPGSA